MKLTCSSRTAAGARVSAGAQTAPLSHHSPSTPQFLPATVLSVQCISNGTGEAAQLLLCCASSLKPLPNDCGLRRRLLFRIVSCATLIRAQSNSTLALDSLVAFCSLSVCLPCASHLISLFDPQASSMLRYVAGAGYIFVQLVLTSNRKKHCTFVQCKC